MAVLDRPPYDEPVCTACGCPVDEHEQPTQGAPCAACFMLALIDPKHQRCTGLATATLPTTTTDDDTGPGPEPDPRG